MTIAAQDVEFETHRRHLFGLAYRMLGSWADAQDVVQETWLRWHAADRTAVDAPRAYLSRVATRLCLDHLRSARVRREHYVGQWLPEPIPQAAAPDETALGMLAQDLSMALLLALERLSASERAAFLLHDVFEVPYAEIAETLGRSQPDCRQLAARARARIRQERPQQRPVSEAEGMRLARAFLAASRGGDLDGLRALLAQDAVLRTDGGGRKPSLFLPIIGRDKVARFFAKVAGKPGSMQTNLRTVWMNGMPGTFGLEADGQPRVTLLDVAHARIAAVYVVRNPDKLAHLLPAH